MPRTGCALGECAMNINPATEGKASYVNADETNELPPPYSRFPQGVADDTPTMATTYHLPFPPPSPILFLLHLLLLLLPSLFVAFINGKKSARRASMVLLVVEKARILSPPIRARHSEPSSRRVGKRRDSLTTAAI